MNTFYANAGADMLGPLRAFYASMAGSFPVGMTIQVENFGDAIDDATGTLVGSWIGGVESPVAGGGAGVYSAPSGACVNWLTNTIVDGRRLRGRTFLVPLTAANYQDDGTLSSTYLGALTTSCAALTGATSATFLVWGRPRAARPANGTIPAVTARAGASALVNASSFKDKVAVLRSRRD